MNVVAATAIAPGGVPWHLMRMPTDEPSAVAPQARDPVELLVRIARQGDRKAFADLFDHFAPRVKAYMRSLGAQDSVAEDLTQDVMLTVWRKAAQFDPAKASVSTWLFAIARNRRIDVIRRERRPEIDPEDPALVSDAPRATDELAIGAQTSERVRAAIAELPADQAEVIRIFYYKGLSHSEIAEMLDIPMGTVKSRLRLASAKLRSALEVLR